MDVTQISIKINQTNQSGGGNTNSPTQTDAPVNSFDQILAMFNFLGQSTVSDGQSDTASLQNVSDKMDGKQTEPTKLSPEDWSNLDSILNAMAAVIQQVQNSPATPQPIPGNKSSASDLPDQPVVSKILSQHPQAFAEVSKELALWIQKVEGLNQTSTSEPNILIQGLAELIGELQSQVNQKSFEVPNNIGKKIQIISNELKTENNLGAFKQFTSLSNKLFDENKLQHNYDSKQVLSMDKNEVLFSTVPATEKRIREGKGYAQGTYITQIEDQSKSNGQPLMVNQQQGTNGWSGTKIESLPSNLTVSNFAPEVSEWIGRYMKITNGQSGSTEASFSLYPEHLGHIEIKITSQQGEVAAQILTDTSLAKEALEGQLQHLRQALQQHGLLVQKLEIVQQTPVSMDLNQANLSFSQGGSSSSQEQRSFTFSQDVAKTQEEADQKEIEKEILSISYGGAAPKLASSIDFTA